MSENNALILGISGVSSSGKTTLARILRDIFPKTFILHEDDFYKTDNEIPVKNGVADWDCLEAIDLPALSHALTYIRQNGMSPPDLVSKEDKNSVGEVSVDHTVIEDLKWKATRWMYQDVPPIAIIDGFLLYSEGMKIVRDQIDVKLFLRTNYQTTKARREARSGYVTLEGFWEDPPGYVDNVVWPNYVKDHSFLFKDGNVEGELNQSVLNGLAIQAAPLEAQKDMTVCLQWAYDAIDAALEKRIARN
ncbi:Nicotinamide riboside kinase [Acrodontium crateriforme]|uniref:Nicotinamide riboside kinase n=1 Tax=Acrodontium crateriforme TaxID=150365 RepID=A0AAQ3MAR1_9PEZI|nr:Nicotinamide riboside kinase [Acrodontium crateriforme]